MIKKCDDFFDKQLVDILLKTNNVITWIKFELNSVSLREND